MYVMRTLRDFFHMGRVEWVTFQVPESQEMEGGAMSWGVEGRVLGALRVIGGRTADMLVGVEAAGTTGIWWVVREVGMRLGSGTYVWMRGVDDCGVCGSIL